VKGAPCRETTKTCAFFLLPPEEGKFFDSCEIPPIWPQAPILAVTFHRRFAPFFHPFLVSIMNQLQQPHAAMADAAAAAAEDPLLAGLGGGLLPFKIVRYSPGQINAELAKQGLVIPDPEPLIDPVTMQLVVGAAIFEVEVCCGVEGCASPFKLTFAAWREGAVLPEEVKTANNKAARHIKDHQRDPVAGHVGAVIDPVAGVKIPSIKKRGSRKGSIKSPNTGQVVRATVVAAAAGPAAAPPPPVAPQAPAAAPVVQSHGAAGNRKRPASVSPLQVAAIGEAKRLRAEVQVLSVPVVEALVAKPPIDSGSDAQEEEGEEDVPMEAEDAEDANGAEEFVKQRPLAVAKLKAAYTQFHRIAKAAGADGDLKEQPWCSCDNPKHVLLQPAAGSKLRLLCSQAADRKNFDLEDPDSDGSDGSGSESDNKESDEFHLPMEDTISALFCPQSVIKGLLWEVKDCNGYDILRQENLEKAVDVDHESELSSAVLIAKPLCVAFDVLSKLLANCGKDEQRVRHVEHLVTQELVCRPREQREAAVGSVLSMVVAMWWAHPARFEFDSRRGHDWVPDGVKVATLLGTALRRALATVREIHDGPLLSSSRNLVLAAQAIVPTNYVRHTPAKYPSQGPRRFTSRECSMLPSRFVLEALLPLLLDAPRTFWSKCIAQSEAAWLAENLLDNLLLQGRLLILTNLRPGFELVHYVQEPQALEWSAQLCARIDRAQNGTGWSISSYQMESFCKLAAFVPGMRTALRARLNIRVDSD
jgi:hypothetical protein